MNILTTLWLALTGIKETDGRKAHEEPLLQMPLSRDVDDEDDSDDIDLLLDTEI